MHGGIALIAELKYEPTNAEAVRRFRLLAISVGEDLRVSISGKSVSIFPGRALVGSGQ
jgi:hypothetical protein